MKTLPLKVFLLIATLAFSCLSQAAQNILVFGDSLSAGYGIARDDSWVHLLQQALKADYPQYTVVNASISGETTSGGLRRIDKALLEHKPAVVIIELGANDALRGTPNEETEKNLRAIITRSRHANAKVLLLGMQIPPNYGLDYAKRFGALYPKLARQQQVSLLPFMLEGIPADQFQSDNLHPDARAQARIMRHILQSLLPLLH
jgi:acyl-CoA thioesterase-1